MDHKNSDSEHRQDSQSSDENGPSKEQENEHEMDAENNKRAKIREQLSHMSFEDIQKLKEKIGSKVYNEVVLGIETKMPRTDLKRVNKNRPREMSSKIRVKTEYLLPPVRKIIKRDPRFDPICGQYNEKIFKDNYKFVNDIRKKEKKELEKELLDCLDPERKKQIKFLIQRVSNQIREHEKRELLKQQRLEETREIREKLKNGEKPIYKRKSERKVGELLNKYEELKKSNKLQKHIIKRQKKGC